MSGVSDWDEQARIRTLIMAEVLQDVPLSARIALWGAGGAGQRFYPAVHDRVSIVVDSAPDSATIKNIAIAEPVDLMHDPPDVILVATDAVSEVSEWVRCHMRPLPKIIDLQRSLPWHCLSFSSSSDRATTILSRLSGIGTIALLEDLCTPEQIIVLANPSGAIALHEQRDRLMLGDGPGIRVFLDKSVGLTKQGSILPVSLAGTLISETASQKTDESAQIRVGAFLHDARAIYRQVGVPVRECSSRNSADGRIAGAALSTPGFLSWGRSLFQEEVPREVELLVGYCVRPRQLGLMILREFAHGVPEMLEAVKRCSQVAGLEILGSVELRSAGQRQAAARSTRGGVWNETEASERGGLPWLLVVIANQDVPKGDRLGRRPPSWTQALKECARNQVANRFSRSTANWLHSTDDSHEAAEVLKSVGPQTGNLLSGAKKRGLVCTPRQCND